MKQYCALVLFFTVLLTSAFCIADEYEKPILFRNAEWGSSIDDTAAVLPEGVNMSDPEVLNYWHSITDYMANEGYNTQYRAPLGCYTYSRSVKKAKVAGYEVDTIFMYFTYEIGDDGLLIRDNEHTDLIYAYYKLTPAGPDSVYEDLLSKLTKIYGDVDNKQTGGSSILYEQNLWYGADGTMVSLVREDYSTGSHYIYIKYGFKGADDCMEAAYNAIVLEERLNAASDTDGL